MAQLTSNGLTLEYEDEGPQDGPVVLLIMGLSSQLTHWPPMFLERLHAAGYRTIRFDNRDIGLSEKLDGQDPPNPLLLVGARQMGVKLKTPYTLVDMARDTRGVLDALDIASAHIVGISMGGMIAQILTARYPKRVRSLTTLLSSTNHLGLPRAQLKIQRAMIKRSPPASERDAAIERSLAVWRLITTKKNGNPPEELYERVASNHDRSYSPAGARRQLAAIIATGDLRRRWTRRVKAPTLVVHGTDDLLVPIACGEDIHHNIAGSVMLPVEGMAHDIPRYYIPEVTNAIIGLCRSADSENSGYGAAA